MITGLDFIGIPSTDADRSRAFYIDTLGLTPDDNAQYEFWVGDTCFGIWEPEKAGREFSPQKNAHLALHVDDIEAARSDLEAKGVSFLGDTFDTGVCFMAIFADPDGNDLMLHQRHAPR
ncbi:MAG: VOC family protein [Solirubrobacterales bacterium]|nr:VOC family protein [Solirubrobacterales bacterium]